MMVLTSDCPSSSCTSLGEPRWIRSLSCRYALMCGNGNLQSPVLFFLPSGRLFLWLPEVPDSHPPLSIQRRFRCNPPAHFLSFPNGNTRNAPDSFPLPLCKNTADKVLHTENDLLTKKKELESKIATKEEEL